MSTKKPARLVLKLCGGSRDPRHSSCLVGLPHHPSRHMWRTMTEYGCIDNETYYYCSECGIICNIAAGKEFPEECFETSCVDDRMAADCRGCNKHE